MDELLISHQSALEYWRYALPSGVPTFATSQEATAYARKIIRRTSLPSFAAGEVFPYWYSTPLHVLTRLNVYQRASSPFQCHVISTWIPDQSFVAAKNGWLISTPEFTFLQIAKDLTLVELVYLACELCGTYAIRGEECMVTRGFSVTNTKKLIGFLEKNSRMKNARKALLAAKLALDNSASPMETIVSMILTLPYRYGGYGLPKPSLNERIDIPAKLRPHIHKSFYKCDMYWPDAKIAVEYDSNAFHLGAQKMNEDALRRNDLTTLGITVMTMTGKQVFKGSFLKTFAHALAKRLNKRLRYDEVVFARKHTALLNEIFELVRMPSENGDFGNQY